jgi:myo-inositol-1(or 4)-monophosphatase
VRAATRHLVGTEAGRAELTTGAGGDTTVEIDRLAESVALERLGRAAAAGEAFSILSEEVGQRDHGAEWPLVLIDPIDGSLNAKQGIPVFAVMLALLDGPRLGDTRVGYVLNLVSGQSWHAVRGAGAFRDGEPVRVLPMQPGRRDFEMVALESSPRSVIRARPLLERAAKLRVFGCMALSIVHTATGGVDVFCAPFRARAFDMAASLLVLREAGGVATDLEGADVFAVPAGLESRTTLLCASDPGVHARALAALREVPA